MQQKQAGDAVGPVVLEPATHADLVVIVQLLERCHLPTDDVPPIVERFIKARCGDAVVGTVALEPIASIGLLRSLAVAPEFRERGLGRKLCDHVLEQARNRGMTTVYLLTTDATGYFQNIGFDTVDRVRAPDAVRATRQFRELCPDSATLMRRIIPPSSTGAVNAAHGAKEPNRP